MATLGSLAFAVLALPAAHGGRSQPATCHCHLPQAMQRIHRHNPRRQGGVLNFLSKGCALFAAGAASSANHYFGPHFKWRARRNFGASFCTLPTSSLWAFHLIVAGTQQPLERLHHPQSATTLSASGACFLIVTSAGAGALVAINPRRPPQRSAFTMHVAAAHEAVPLVRWLACS